MISATWAGPAGRRRTLLLAICLAMAAGLGAQQPVALKRAVALTLSPIYVSPDKTSVRVGTARPGEGVGIQRRSGGFVQVFTGVSGWMADRGLVLLTDPRAPEIMFGAAAGLQMQAENSGGERQAALDSARLYLDVYHDFPHDRRAAQALYRGAEIHWELKLNEMPRHASPSERQFPATHELKQVIGKFHGTPWAERAAYQLLVTHFTCGDWTQKPDCAVKEADRYRDYVQHFPNGPMSAEAAYDALYRQAIAWTLYNAAGKNHHPGKARRFALLVAQESARIEQAYPNTDWSALSALVAFNVARGTPLRVPAATPLGGP